MWKQNATQNQQITESQETQPPEPSLEPNADSIPADSEEGIDVDLTVLSSTMVYSEVYSVKESRGQPKSGALKQAIEK